MFQRLSRARAVFRAPTSFGSFSITQRCLSGAAASPAINKPASVTWTSDGPATKAPPKTSVKFSTNDGAGQLGSILQVFQKNNVNLTRIQSKPSKRSSDYDFYADFQGTTQDEHVQRLLAELRTHARDVAILESLKVPWFPKTIRDLDHIANKILDAGADLESDHPGFNDVEYRKRRAEQAQWAIDFRHGDRIPEIKYTPAELNTWTTIWHKLMPLYQKHACAEYLRMLPLLVQNCGYRADNIPQLQHISDFLKDTTGFTLRPVAGLLSARNFLYGLAFRVFFSTQYIRHNSNPLYTPEPDICHEILGHAPLFADKEFADFSQELGLASIGATDDQITKLARCYWFSVEFGLCMQKGERKAYGAGLLSSFGELEYSMGSEPEIRPWDPYSAAEQPYPITTYQPIYYAAESFEDAKKKLQDYSANMAKPFGVRYDPYTQSVDVDANVEISGGPTR